LAAEPYLLICTFSTPNADGGFEAMRYDSVTAVIRRRSTLAREKNTSRAEGRRRTKETQRAELAALETETGEDEVEYAVSTGQSDKPVRKPLFKMPNIREDVRLLPSIVRSKPILLLPLALFLGGLIVFMMLPQLPVDIQGLAGYYIQFFFAPPALFTFFIAGFFAPRASYLIGFIYGLIAGVIWSIAIVTVGSVQTTDSAVPATTENLPLLIGNMMVIGILYGTLAASLASWYRDFLRGMQERGKQRRADKEVDERAKRAAERQEARKVAKQRPTS
jgi:hypothetical protein